MYSALEIDNLIDDLYNVGKCKMLGYLPLDTINSCGKDLNEVEKN